ncbi:MAG: Mce/MlaD family protein [Solirubrobacteraceae bacterium]
MRPLHLAYLGLAVGAVLLPVLELSGSSPTVTVVVPEATGLVTSQRISDGAKDIGDVSAITPVDGGRAARLTLEITDPALWPLRRSTRVEIRLGGTVSYSNRYLLLSPGTTGPVVRDGGALPAANIHVPYEIDTLINQLTPPVRGAIRGAINGGAGLFSRSDPQLNQLLARGPALTGQLAGVVTDLNSDQVALGALVRSTGRVVGAVDTSNPDIRVLLDGLAGTVNAVASQSGALQTGISRLPQAIAQTVQTLAHARKTLAQAAVLTDALAPGVSQLRRTTAPLTRVLETLRGVTPYALAALAASQRAALSDGASLLRTLGSIAPTVRSTVSKAATQVGCLRPYTPEIVGFGQTWGDWMSPVDNQDHLIRAQIQSFLPANNNSTGYTPQYAVTHFPGITYGFPRPPGELAGQPWFQPQCGVTSASLDPSKDREGQSFSAAQAAGLGQQR